MSSSTFIYYSTTPADVIAVLTGSPALYFEDSITPVDVPAVLGGHPSLLVIFFGP